ncbi:hypothetical protein KJZ99_04105 [bacterium]|nr:hypothetical protein [bacterium]
MADGPVFRFEFDRNELKSAAIANPERAAAIVMEALTVATKGALFEIHPVVLGLLNERIGPQVTGNLANAFSQEVTEVQDAVEGKLMNAASYAVPVEEGGKPHMPPLWPLVIWARRKFGLGPREAIAMGKAMQWKIKAHGTKGKWFMRDGFEKSRPKIESIYNSMHDAVLEKLTKS